MALSCWGSWDSFFFGSKPVETANNSSFLLSIFSLRMCHHPLPMVSTSPPLLNNLVTSVLVNDLIQSQKFRVVDLYLFHAFFQSLLRRNSGSPFELMNPDTWTKPNGGGSGSKYFCSIIACVESLEIWILCLGHFLALVYET